ncbi:hypothetical protein [uncultured Ruminococcus sp.]|jgi:hypothetical protein|uniref:hypothetical protein n=1 Tax=uncultured Ruminococcus sp. TaxID=165186 RepID=UPI0026051162|nr:hypothetical protein [uncultured Ruminococcus sp.]
MRRGWKKRNVIIVAVVLLALGMTAIWEVMQQSTNAVVREIENAVQDDTYRAVSEHGLTMEERLLLHENQVKYEEYHWDQIFDDYRLYYSPTREMSIEAYLEGYTIQNVEIRRTYTLHNFHSGYIWVVIHFDVVDKNGDVIMHNQGGPKAGTKFQIEKQNGKWQIMDFYEQDSYETMSDKIYYLLPNWDLAKQ